ncbi:MAG: hypothetical protein RLZZ443_802 [Actinomycetota bacterium]|jgi:peptide/nickel transport system substrate-binding protein
MKLHKKVLGALASAATAALVLVGGVTGAEAANKADLVIGAQADITSWNPTQANIGHYIHFYQAVYDNLIIRDPKGNYKPNLATDWTISEGGTKIVMNLRKGVVFSDGAKFDAAAAKANLDAFVKGNGPYAAPMSMVTTQVTGPLQITLKLSKLQPEILYYLSTTGSFMASPAAINSTGIKTKPVGSGPYIFDSGTVGAQYVLKANPKYWDKSKQKFSQITFKILPDTTARLTALLSGQVDVTMLDAKTAPTAKSKGFGVNENYVDWKGLLMFDRDGVKNKAIGDVRVRQAIAYAINRPALLKAVEYNGQVTNQVFGTSTSAYQKKYDSYYTYNPTKAKQLLADAGYADGFTLDLPTWVEPNLNALLEGYLKDVGIKVRWVSDTNWYPNAKAGKYAAIVMQIFQGTDLVTLNTLVNQGTWNALKSQDPAIQNATDSMAFNSNPKNVSLQMGKVNDFLVQQAWFVPFYRIPTLIASSNRVKVVSQTQNVMPYIYNYSPSGK